MGVGGWGCRGPQDTVWLELQCFSSPGGLGWWPLLVRILTQGADVHLRVLGWGLARERRGDRQIESRAQNHGCVRKGRDGIWERTEDTPQGPALVQAHRRDSGLENGPPVRY